MRTCFKSLFNFLSLFSSRSADKSPAFCSNSNMVPRLDEGSKAVKLLRKKLDSGEIGPDDDARTVQALDPLFLEYKPETFRVRFKRLKKEYFDDDDGMFQDLFLFLFF